MLMVSSHKLKRSVFSGPNTNLRLCDERQALPVCSIRTVPTGTIDDSTVKLESEVFSQMMYTPSLFQRDPIMCTPAPASTTGVAIHQLAVPTGKSAGTMKTRLLVYQVLRHSNGIQHLNRITTSTGAMSASVAERVTLYPNLSRTSLTAKDSK